MKCVILLVPAQIEDVACKGVILREPALLCGVLPDALGRKVNGLRRVCVVALAEGRDALFIQDAPDIV